MWKSKSNYRIWFGEANRSRDNKKQIIHGDLRPENIIRKINMLLKDIKRNFYNSNEPQATFKQRPARPMKETELPVSYLLQVFRIWYLIQFYKYLGNYLLIRDCSVLTDQKFDE